MSLYYKTAQQYGNFFSAKMCGWIMEVYTNIFISLSLETAAYQPLNVAHKAQYGTEFC